MQSGGCDLRSASMPRRPEVSAFLPGLRDLLRLEVAPPGDTAGGIGLAAAGRPAMLRRGAIAGGFVLRAAGDRRMRPARAAARAAGQGETGREEAAPRPFAAALWQIVVADLPVGLDAVFGAAAVARARVMLRMAGLLRCVAMMAVHGAWLARILDRDRIIAYIGVAFIAWIGSEWLWEGILVSNAHLGHGLPLPPAH
ncbi:MAG: hypothetical protein N3D18_01810 [Roseococcus sp.]|nr:hypothetical protein [Roseococcus sp.]